MTATKRHVISPDERWRGLVGMYGGYVAGLFADTAAAEKEYRLTSLDVRFLASVRCKRMVLEVAAVHRGSRTALTRMRLKQDDRLRAEATAVLLRHTQVNPVIRRIGTPQRTPPADYLPRPHVQGDLAFVRNLEIYRRSAFGVEDGGRAWLRLKFPIGELGLRTPYAAACVLMDALLPVALAGPRPPAFVPTLEFQYLFTPAVPSLYQQWFVAENHLDWLSDGFCAEDATLQEAETGTLVARQRQLRSIREQLAVSHQDLHDAVR